MEIQIAASVVLIEGIRGPFFEMWTIIIALHHVAIEADSSITELSCCAACVGKYSRCAYPASGSTKSTRDQRLLKSFNSRYKLPMQPINAR